MEEAGGEIRSVGFLGRLRSVFRRPQKNQPRTTSSSNAESLTRDIPNNLQPAPVSQPEKPQPLAEPLVEQKLGIGDGLQKDIKEAGLESTGFEKVGEPALGRTNEKGSRYLFEEISNRKDAPDGYLIGIGASNVFSVLKAFSKDKMPVGIILFDIDPAVVKAGEKMVAGFKESAQYSPFPADRWVGQEIFSRIAQANPDAAIKKYAPKLHELAKRGNFTIIRADFTDQRIIDRLAKLPGLAEHNNVIYLSNIADHLWRAKYNSEQGYLPNFDYLKVLEPNSLHRNYYIDTLQVGLDYNLRVDDKPPQFKPHDFNPLFMGNLKIQTEMADRLSNTSDVVWQDLAQVGTTELHELYEQFKNSPTQREKLDFVAGLCNDQRQFAADRYSKKKEEHGTAIYEDHGLERVVQLTAEEEQATLAELKKPYDYYEHFIPYVAKYIWQEASDPSEIRLDAIPRRKVFERNERGELAMVVDPRDKTTGEIEKWLLEIGVSYSEMAMAKIHREVKRRVGDKGEDLSEKSTSVLFQTAA